MGLFDFDVVHRGFKIEDVALALFVFGRERRERTESVLGQRAFVDEYERAAPLTQLGRQALPMMTVVVQARTAPRYALRQRGGQDPARALRAHVARMRALETQMASLAPALFDGR